MSARIVEAVLRSANVRSLPLASGTIHVVPERELDPRAVLERLRGLTRPEGWLTTTGQAYRVVGRLPEIAGRLLHADLWEPEAGATWTVRPSGASYVLRRLTRLDGADRQGVLVTRVYRSIDGGPRLRYETCWGPDPQPRDQAGDAGWTALAHRFVGFERELT